MAKLSVGGGTAAAVGTAGRGSGVATGASGERIVARSTAVSVAVTVNSAPFADVLGFGTATSALCPAAHVHVSHGVVRVAVDPVTVNGFRPPYSCA